jgi:DNA-binding transcriptional regulator YhcF (GntR family)
MPTERSNWVPEVENRNKPVYLAIADAIADDIRAGKLSPGQRLPPQRLLAGHMGIDFTTVSRAYVEARHRGLVEARVGQGTFVRAPSAAHGAANRSLAAKATARIVDMTMNQPPLPDLPELRDRLREGMAAAAMRLDLPDILHYPGAGDAREDRMAGAARLAPRLPDIPAPSACWSRPARRAPCWRCWRP